MAKYIAIPHNPEGSQDEDDTVELFNSPEQSNSETTEKDTLSESDDEILTTMGSRKTWKNICILAVVFILLFMAYNGLVDLQSSLFIDEGLGVMTQSVVYASFSLSCLFLPKVIITKLGHKRTISVSMTGYLLWMAANGYATWLTMSVTSFMVGICAAPLWTAQTTYITTLAESYAKSRKKPIEPTIALFFGVFNALFQIAAFCGNIISWFILRQEQTNTTSMESVELQVCGAGDCASSNDTNVNSHYKKVPGPILWTLVAVYLCIGILGLVLSIIFLDDLRSQKKSRKTENMKDSVLAALRHHKNIKHLLLIPLAMCNGMEMVFIWADFNKSYVTCAIGVWMVGLVFLPSVTLNCVASLSVGKLSSYIHRMFFIVTAFLINIVVLCFLLFWKPNPDQMAIFFFVPGLMGLAAGTQHVALTSIIAVTFSDKETAFACIRFWSALGAAIAFGINKFLCVRHKIYINCIGLAIWFTCYMIFERIVKKKSLSRLFPKDNS